MGVATFILMAFHNVPITNAEMRHDGANVATNIKGKKSRFSTAEGQRPAKNIATPVEGGGGLALPKRASSVYS